ncbi:MAG: hypothetical protein WBV93_04000, partial [Anaerobacillus sp.]
FDHVVKKPEAFLTGYEQQDSEAPVQLDRGAKEARVIESEQLSNYAQPVKQDSDDFKEKQVEILEGKTLLKNIHSSDGTLLFEEGSVLSREQILKAQNTSVGVVVEMSMHVSE